VKHAGRAFMRVAMLWCSSADVGGHVIHAGACLERSVQNVTGYAWWCVLGIGLQPCPCMHPGPGSRRGLAAPAAGHAGWAGAPARRTACWGRPLPAAAAPPPPCASAGPRLLAQGQGRTLNPNRTLRLGWTGSCHMHVRLQPHARRAAGGGPCARDSAQGPHVAPALAAQCSGAAPARQRAPAAAPARSSAAAAAPERHTCSGEAPWASCAAWSKPHAISSSAVAATSSPPAGPGSARPLGADPQEPGRQAASLHRPPSALPRATPSRTSKAGSRISQQCGDPEPGKL